jgi:hypothetical protein
MVGENAGCCRVAILERSVTDDDAEAGFFDCFDKWCAARATVDGVEKPFAVEPAIISDCVFDGGRWC